MGYVYHKRYRMELDLSCTPLPSPVLPARYAWVAWQAGICPRHAAVKFDSFRDEIDARVFNSLASLEGCTRLMQEIARRDAFLPGATWLVQYRPGWGAAPEDCGTIQALSQQDKVGAIQNVGVAPEHRGRGLGRALVLRALQGFRDAGLARASLEVTVQNETAVHLYRTLGFRCMRTSYKVAEEVPTHV